MIRRISMRRRIFLKMRIIRIMTAVLWISMRRFFVFVLLILLNLTDQYRETWELQSWASNKEYRRYYSYPIFILTSTPQIFQVNSIVIILKNKAQPSPSLNQNPSISKFVRNLVIRSLVDYYEFKISLKTFIYSSRITQCCDKKKSSDKKNFHKKNLFEVRGKKRDMIIGYEKEIS